MAELSENMPVWEIQDYILHKVEEKKRIEQEIEELEVNIVDLRTKKSELANYSTSALQSYTITQGKLNWYLKIKQELEKYGIPVDDISRLGI